MIMQIFAQPNKASIGIKIIAGFFSMGLFASASLVHAESVFHCVGQAKQSIQLILDNSESVRICNTTTEGEHNGTFTKRLSGAVLRAETLNSSAKQAFSGTTSSAPVQLTSSDDFNVVDVEWSMAPCASCRPEYTSQIRYQCQKIESKNQIDCKYYDSKNDGEVAHPKNMEIFRYMLLDVQNFSGPFNSFVSLVSKDGKTHLSIGFFKAGVSYYGNQGIGGGNDDETAIRYARKLLNEGAVFKQGSNARGTCLLNELLTKGSINPRSECYSDLFAQSQTDALASCVRIIK